jgi:hypothetical protein
MRAGLFRPAFNDQYAMRNAIMEGPPAYTITFKMSIMMVFLPFFPTLEAESELSFQGGSKNFIDYERANRTLDSHLK